MTSTAYECYIVEFFWWIFVVVVQRESIFTFLWMNKEKGTKKKRIKNHWTFRGSICKHYKIQWNSKRWRMLIFCMKCIDILVLKLATFGTYNRLTRWNYINRIFYTHFHVRSISFSLARSVLVVKCLNRNTVGMRHSLKMYRKNENLSKALQIHYGLWTQFFLPFFSHSIAEK